MEVRSFFSEELAEDSSEVVLAGDELHHLSRVLRLKPGARIRIFNGEGIGAAGVIESINAASATIKIEQTRRSNRGESPIEITLITALLKGDRTELVIQKATELGASELFIFSSEHAVAELTDEKKPERLRRWQKVTIGAAKQCGRTRVPKLSYFSSLNDALSVIESDFRIMLFEKEGARGVKELAGEYAGEAGIALLIGPEGGFAEDEITSAEGAGFLSARMGPRRLRAETAAVAALSAIQYELGDLGMATLPEAATVKE